MLRRQFHMSKIGKLLETKGADIWSVKPDDSVFSAIQMMDEKGIGALAVISEDKLVGIISERDCARRVILKKLPAEDTSVKDIMTKDVFYTHLEQTVNDCFAVMTQRHIRHLPVIDNGKLLGMISLGDLVKDVIAEQQFKIDNLENTLSWGESY